MLLDLGLSALAVWFTWEALDVLPGAEKVPPWLKPLVVLGLSVGAWALPLTVVAIIAVAGAATALRSFVTADRGSAETVQMVPNRHRIPDLPG